jgi:Ni,Fe-hydrogenase III large subunit
MACSGWCSSSTARPSSAAAPTIGYLHTGIEKTAEQKKFQQVIPLVERMDYLERAVQRLRLLPVGGEAARPRDADRVKWIRVLLAELQRINSHLVWLGTHAMEVGAVSVMLYCFRERELLLDINERIAGFRMFPSYIRVGGLREDLPRGFHDVVTQFLESFPVKLDEYEDLLTKNDIYRKRTQGVGKLSMQDCMNLSLTGPSVARQDGTTTFARCFRTAATRHSSSTSAWRERRRVRALPRSHRRDARERQDLPPGAVEDFSCRRFCRGRADGRAAAQGSRVHRNGSVDSALPDLLAGVHGSGG